MGVDNSKSPELRATGMRTLSGISVTICLNEIELVNNVDSWLEESSQVKMRSLVSNKSPWNCRRNIKRRRWVSSALVLNNTETR